MSAETDVKLAYKTDSALIFPSDRHPMLLDRAFSVKKMRQLLLFHDERLNENGARYMAWDVINDIRPSNRTVPYPAGTMK